jgi:protein KTI12
VTAFCLLFRFMPLILICGCPRSGKSEVALQLCDVLEKKGQKCVVVRDQGLADYEDANAEKKSRGELFSAVERALSKEMVVIVDALNYIKAKERLLRLYRGD